MRDKKSFSYFWSNIYSVIRESSLFHILLLFGFIVSVISLITLPAVLKDRAIERSIVTILDRYDEINSISYQTNTGNLLAVRPAEFEEYKHQLQPGNLLSAYDEDISSEIDAHLLTFYFYVDHELLFATEIYSIKNELGIDGIITGANNKKIYIAKVDGVYRELPQYKSLWILESEATEPTTIGDGTSA